MIARDTFNPREDVRVEWATGKGHFCRVCEYEILPGERFVHVFNKAGNFDSLCICAGCYLLLERLR